MEKFLLIDTEKCTGCLQCALACSFKNESIFSLSRARVGVMWIAEVDKMVPVVCQHCSRPLCMDICPMCAISRSEETGAVILNSDLCIGCKMCMVVCPFGAPVFDMDSGIMMKCDLCGGNPECVKHCAYGALTWVTSDEATIVKRLAGAKRLAEIIEKIVL